MRTFIVCALELLLEPTAFAATLVVEVDRNCFDGPVEVAVAPRVDGQPPRWSAAKPLPAGSSKLAVKFDDLTEGLYTVLVRAHNLCSV